MVRTGKLLLGSAAGLLFAAAGYAVLSPDDPLRVVEREVIYNVFDAGLSDFDRDGRLERWTVNHSSAHWFSVENAALAFPQDFSLPGFDPDGFAHDVDALVWIRLDESTFVVETQPGGSVSGRLRIPWETRVDALEGASATQSPCAPEPACTVISFAAADGGQVRMTPVPAPSDGFPVRFTLDPAVDLASVALGRQGLRPETHEFGYSSKDRHGFVVLDELADTPLALFISRGGARGLLPQIAPDERDEFLVRRDDAWVDEAARRTLVKAGCPGRQAGTVDIDRDGREDIYQVCGRSAGDNSGAENRLYVQNADGTFTERAAEYGLALDGDGSFRFLPPKEDGDLRLLWVTDTAVELYRAPPQGEPFAQVWSLARDSSVMDKIVIADVSGDAAPEALVFSRFGNLLLDLAGELPEQLSLVDAGLPAASTDGSVVDIDGDGRFDVFTVPQGVFLRSEAGGFARSEMVDLDWIDPFRQQVRHVWFDRDLDGDLDLWLLTDGGWKFPRPFEGLFLRLPDGIQARVQEAGLPVPLARRFWMSEVYENGLDHGQTRFVVDCSDGFMRSGLDYTADTSRFSESLQGFFVSGDACPRDEGGDVTATLGLED